MSKDNGVPSGLVTNSLRPSSFVAYGSANKELLRISPDGEVTAPDLESASEAGRVFVESVKHRFPNIERLEAEDARLRSALEKVERRLRPHEDDTAEDDRRDKRIAHGIVKSALSQEATRIAGEKDNG